MDAYIGESPPRTSGGEQTTRARRVLVVYGEPYGDRSFVSVHEVESGKGDKLRLAPGRPLTSAFTRRFLKEVGEDLKPEYLPPCVLYHTHVSLVWWTPPRREQMRFRTGSELEDVSGKSIALPGLVWRLAGGSLAIRAVAGAERPMPDTRLAVAPVWNTAPSDGVVCEGSMPRPRTRGPGSIEAWEDGFFGSEFTHQAGAGSLVSGSESFVGLMKRLASERTDFPDAALNLRTTTLAAFATPEER